MNFKSLFSSLVLTVLSSNLVFAGDVTFTEPYGFNADGTQFAYIESGSQDGSGFTYATMTFLDVKNNKFSAKAITTLIEEENATVKQAINLTIKKSRQTLRSLGISKVNSATLVASQKPTSIQDKDLIEFSIFQNTPVRMTHSLKLTTKLAKEKSNCYFDEEPKLLKLVLTDSLNSKTVTLQEDQRLPASRNCPFDYKIRDVLVSETGNALVVLVDVISTGFEGPDYRTIPISGLLN